MDSIINYLDKYSEQLFIIQVGFLIIILSVLVWIWYYNRKKYQHLKHQIPASVVKSYLDSIIQNSTALKSSLFRGGGVDVDPNNIPSVMPLSDLPGDTQVGVDGGGDAALKAQIAQLQAQLTEKSNQVNELEAKNADLEGIVKQKQERIEELEKLLAEAQASGGGDPEAAAKVTELSKERDALKEELDQYNLISDDIANNKRLKQENEQLKKALDEAGGSAPEPAAEPAPEAAAPAAEAEPEAKEAAAEPEAQEEPAPAEEAAVEEPAAQEQPEEAQEAAPEAPEAKDDGDDKSPEDLLSEFEKMLG